MTFRKFLLISVLKTEALLYSVSELMTLLQVKHILIKGLVFFYTSHIPCINLFNVCQEPTKCI